MTDIKTKKRCLALFDWACSTGFAQVAKNIVKNLDATGEFEFHIVGINYSGEPYDMNEWPGLAWPAVNALNRKYHDLHGRQLFIDLLQQNDYDLVFIIQD